MIELNVQCDGCKRQPINEEEVICRECYDELLERVRELEEQIAELEGEE